MFFFPDRLINISFNLCLEGFFVLMIQRLHLICQLILYGEIRCRLETCRNGGHGENVPLRAAVGKTIQLCKESFIITI